MSQLMPYPEYGDESLQLLGRLPKGWKATPVKVMGNLSGGAGFPHDEQGVEDQAVEFHKVNALGSADAHGYLGSSENTISEETASRLRARIFPSETIVFAKVGAALLLSRFRRLRQRACLDNNMMGLEVAPRHSPSFVRYALGTLPMSYVVNPGAVPSVNEGGVGNLQLPGPPLKEQTQIAKFLDYETAKIDALIDKQQQLIALLKEKRQAVISHAVTKGLNPNAPMKESGVEWLGEVPAHWVVAKLARFIRIGSGEFLPNSEFASDKTKERCIPVVGGNGVTGWGTIANSPAGTLVIGRVGALCGNVHLVKSRSWITDNALRVEFSDRFEPDFLAMILRVRNLNDLADKSAQPLITGGRIKTQPMPVPPSQEQVEISRHLRTVLPRYDELEERAGLAVELLQERRTALISAAVTGKIDVRNWQAPEADKETP